MKVRAKFVVEEVRKFRDHGTVRLLPVVSGSEENKHFFKWTPAGAIEMACASLEVADSFVPGVEYYVDFIKADES